MNEISTTARSANFLEFENMNRAAMAPSAVKIISEPLLFDVGEAKPIEEPFILDEEEEVDAANPVDLTTPMKFEPKLSDAVFSPCGKYRYLLRRRFSQHDPKKTAFFCAVNPSIADHEVDDPTVRRMVNLSTREGCDAMVLVNAGAYVATDPRDFRKQFKTGVDVIGPENEKFIRESVENSALVVVCWGNGGAFKDIGIRAYETIVKYFKGTVYCLGKTKHGHPRHPLFLRNDVALERFEL